MQGSHRDTNLEKRLEDTVGKGEGGLNWESSTETLTLLYVKWRASGNLLHDAGNSKPVLCDNLKEWDGGRRDGDSTGRGHVYTYG